MSTTAPNTECPICGAPLPASSSGAFYALMTTLTGGWRLCATHKVYLKSSKFDGRCSACLGPIALGEPVLLCKLGSKWTALHPRERCEGQPAAPTGPYARLHLCDDAPWEVVMAAYKALALLNHPDHGGEVERMKQINNALDEIRSRRP